MPTRLTWSGGASAPSGVVRWLALLRIEVNQQDHVWRMGFERGLYRVMHFLIRMDLTLPLHSSPARTWAGAPGTTGRRRIAKQPAIVAFLQVEVVPGAMPEVGQVFVVQIVDGQRHTEVIAL